MNSFAMHPGLLQYKNLIYGVNSAFDIFQQQTELVLSEIVVPRMFLIMFLSGIGQKEKPLNVLKTFLRVVTNIA